jgi:hypothetical protein
MKVRKNLVLKIVIALVIAFIAVNVLGYLSGLGYIIKDVKKGKQREVRLLCETDHHVLLEACRELSRRVTTGDLKPQQYNVRLNPHPEASRFPQAILDLEPTYVIINPDGHVMVELHGGFLHYGVMAYPENYEKPIINFKYGDKELIPGLWYYDEDYDGNPKQQKRIEELIQKGKMRRMKTNTDSGNISGRVP